MVERFNVLHTETLQDTLRKQVVRCREEDDLPDAYCCGVDKAGARRFGGVTATSDFGAEPPTDLDFSMLLTRETHPMQAR